MDHRSEFDRLRKSDSRAFESLYRANHARLCAFANSILRNPASAEDVVHDVFVALWANRKALAVPASPRAYLYASVRNRALNDLRRRAITDAWEESQGFEDEADSSRPPSPSEAVEAEETRLGLKAALDTLSPRAKIAATLRWYEQMSYAEIAEAMGISEKSVENQLSRAVKALRLVIEPD